MRIPLPQEVCEILSALENRGYEAYAVGGCVRDSLLGKTPFDWDITTNAKPEEVECCFSENTVLKTGIQHGTVTLLWNQTPYEITTYRLETGYQDHRHPDEVSFVSDLREDLKRRDFTVNAMAYAPKVGLVDYFNGQSDLQQRVIRAVGEPSERFSEDALRILRALRFASVLGFTIEKKTALQIHKMARSCSFVAKERIFSEWKKLLCGQSAGRILADYADVWKEIFGFTAAKEAAKMLAYLPKNFSLRMAALFLCERLSLEQAKGWMRAQKYDSKTIAKILSLLEVFEEELPKTTIALKKCLLGCDIHTYSAVLILHESWCQAFLPDHLSDVLKTKKMFFDLNFESLCTSVQDLTLSGQDLLGIGIPAGKELGSCLNFLLHEVTEERLENNRKILLQAAKTFFERNLESQL